MNDDRAAALGRLRASAALEVRDLDESLHALFEASKDTNADDEHDPEGSTIAYERAQLTAVLDAARRRLGDLDEALARVEDGTYGVCTVCRREIAAERLEARPFARTCVECA
ncbi:TraR/DksA family transcriptional regulator [Actinoplanes sp. NPDC049265]|uniref:TraR/DksA family transcriptional regulator n=1 Tax=Actinoplanes sp. NPDC049265 TaxID=3363902 RepID=UPI00371F7637